MTDFSTLLQQGASNAWLFIPSAMLLGALHGLEPGHSKTMMAAFIVAIRGTVSQAVLLGISATISHTAVVWLVALLGMYFGQRWSAENTEPYLQTASAVLIIAVALWMMWRTWREQKGQARDAAHTHGHHDETRRIDTGHGVVQLEIFETGIPPKFRLTSLPGAANWAATEVTVTTTRPEGATQTFAFVQQDGFLQSVEDIPEPHEFSACLTLGHGGHSHNYNVEFKEADHGHNHDHTHAEGLDVSSPGFQDAHERAHAEQIRDRFSSREVTTGQIAIFGLTGGLIPCPAAITVLLLCLQLKEVTLGAALVLCFSIGLALTLVLSGVVAAIGVRHVSKKWSGFSELARGAPYISGTLILLVGLYVGYHGITALLSRT
jgi:nickel/cobalt exporter